MKLPKLLCTLLTAASLSCVAWAQGAEKLAPGPAVGAKVPAFELKDQNGQARTLQSLMGPKGLMLVFYRSADW